MHVIFVPSELYWKIILNKFFLLLHTVLLLQNVTCGLLEKRWFYFMGLDVFISVVMERDRLPLWLTKHLVSVFEKGILEMPA